MHVWSTKADLCNFTDFTNKWSAIIIVLKKLALYTINMNGKSQANNVVFKFSLLGAILKHYGRSKERV